MSSPLSVGRKAVLRRCAATADKKAGACAGTDAGVAAGADQRRLVAVVKELCLAVPLCLVYLLFAFFSLGASGIL